MLNYYGFGEKGLETLPAAEGVEVPAGTGWVDLFLPSADENRAVERFLGAAVPTREEAQEIEFSSRFYSEDGATFMTATVLSGVDAGQPELAPFTIAMAGERIVTLHYNDLRALRHFLTRAGKPGSGCSSAPAVFIGLVEAIIDRAADVLERISGDVDRINQDVFARRRDPAHEGRELSELIAAIGVQGDLAAKARESLASLERLVQFAGLAAPSINAKGNNRARMKLAARDIRSLEDHVTFLSNKINFLLDATLGLISVEQNEVIRVLTVLSTFFFPPTLIGTIYGMNFQFMPELSWPIAYPLVIGAMIVSALVPYFYFKRRGWL
jgi:magnesium transporter